jgi:hypothetical protein
MAHVTAAILAVTSPISALWMENLKSVGVIFSGVIASS